MDSERFARPIVVTAHARIRMAERRVDDALLLELIETGEARYKDETRLWIAKSFDQRDDNLLCAALVLEHSLVVKTVMHRFSWKVEP